MQRSPLETHVWYAEGQLQRLPKADCAAFVLACAERLYPLFAHFCHENGKPFEGPIRQLLDDLWMSLLDDSTRIDSAVVANRLRPCEPDLSESDSFVETHALQFVTVVRIAADGVTRSVNVRDALVQVFTPFLTLLSPDDYQSAINTSFFAAFGELLSAVPEVLREIQFQKADIATLKSEALDRVVSLISQRARANALAEPSAFCDPFSRADQ